MVQTQYSWAPRVKRFTAHESCLAMTAPIGSWAVRQKGSVEPLEGVGFRMRARQEQSDMPQQEEK